MMKQSITPTSAMSCWHDERVYTAMREAFLRHLPMADISHGKVLIKTLEPYQHETILDVGCGSGIASTIIRHYVGVDHPDMIENVSKRCCKYEEFIPCDILNDDITFFRDYNVLLMNAFLDVLENPLIILKKICSFYKGTIIIHRQIMDTVTQSQITTTYAGFPCYGSKISYFDLLDTCKGFALISDVNSGLENYHTLCLHRG